MLRPMETSVTLSNEQTARTRLETSRSPIDLSGRPLVMGVLNVTPDSFSDGGRFVEPAAAVEHALRMVEEGADIIDVGGESTRPGSKAVCAEEQVRRCVPVIEQIAAESNVAISIDTTIAEVARVAIEAGACVINDISALRFDPEMGRVAAETKAAVCLMHMLGEPRTMQQNPTYKNVTAEVCRFLTDRIECVVRGGVSRERILIDPGIGFGKTLTHNLRLLGELKSLVAIGYPVVIGTSRKRFIGAVLDRSADERLWGTAATVAWAVRDGAKIVRVHDVGPMRQIVDMTWAMMNPDRFEANLERP